MRSSSGCVGIRGLSGSGRSRAALCRVQTTGRVHDDARRRRRLVLARRRSAPATPDRAVWRPAVRRHAGQGRDLIRHDCARRREVSRGHHVAVAESRGVLRTCSPIHDVFIHLFRAAVAGRRVSIALEVRPDSDILVLHNGLDGLTVGGNDAAVGQTSRTACQRRASSHPGRFTLNSDYSSEAQDRRVLWRKVWMSPTAFSSPHSVSVSVNFSKERSCSRQAYTYIGIRGI